MIKKTVMKQKDYQHIIDKIYKFSHLGIETSELIGATLIGKAPYVAPLAVLNSIYPPISDETIEYIEKEIGLKIPLSYKYFLTHVSNGLKIFTTTFCLYGYRPYPALRTMDGVRQPFSIIRSNQYKSERPANATNDMLFIGFYDDDGSRLYMTPDEKVHFCKHDDATSLMTWNSLKEMLESEIDRLYALYDDNGVPFDMNAPTVPIV